MYLGYIMYRYKYYMVVTIKILHIGFLFKLLRK